MRKLNLLLILFLYQNVLFSQNCTLLYDNIEVYTWFGNWNTPANTGFYTNAFVSSTASGVLYGNGNGSSGIESANYILPNVTGLDISYSHKISFRLGSYRISGPTAATAGVDGPDYIDVRYSTNNGTTFTTEMRITGNANAYWDYNILATAAKTANGVMTTYSPVSGGNRTATGDGYSIIELTIPAGANQLAFTLNCRVNSAGEEWWIDNIELIQLGPCSVLPIELISFEGVAIYNDSHLFWSTATEQNSDYFEIQRSINAIEWLDIGRVGASINSTDIKNYTFIDYDLFPNIYYYRLKQVDLNGAFKIYNTISITHKDDYIDCIYKYYDLMGREINFELASPGIYIRSCNDKKMEKIWKK